MLASMLLSACRVSRTEIDMTHIPVIPASLWLKVNDNPNCALEGPAFDRKGDFYFVDVEGGGKVFKVNMADKTVSTYYNDPGHSGFASIKIHKDGRLFLCGYLGGDIVAINPDGTLSHVTRAIYRGHKLVPDDMVFDKNGNYYFSSYEGDYWDPKGGVYRVSAGSDNIELVCNRIASANGVSLSPDGRQLWVAETLWTGSLGRSLQKYDLQQAGKSTGSLTPSTIYGFPDGTGWPDSNAVDMDGNIYQAMAQGSRIFVLNPQGAALAQVVIPAEYGDGYKNTYNLAFQPGADTGFITASGARGGAIFAFKALAKGLPLFSHE
jgi:sugar lactone lactonase YvrE